MQATRSSRVMACIKSQVGEDHGGAQARRFQISHHRRLQQTGHIRVYETCWNCQFFRKDTHSDEPRGCHHCTFVDAPLAEPNPIL